MTTTIIVSPDMLARTKFLDSNGYVTPPWRELLRGLWLRVGGAAASDSSDISAADPATMLFASQFSAVAKEAQAASVAPAQMRAPAAQPDLSPLLYLLLQQVADLRREVGSVKVGPFA